MRSENDIVMVRPVVIAELIERITALTAENAVLKARNEEIMQAALETSAAKGERIRELEAERDEHERKGKDLCSAYGNSLIEIHDLKAQVTRLMEPVSDVDLSRG